MSSPGLIAGRTWDRVPVEVVSPPLRGAAMTSPRPAAFAVLASICVAGCGGGGYGGSAGVPPGGQAGPPAPGTSAVAWSGRFVGSVAINGTEHFADALVTQDGKVHIHVGEPGLWSGAMPTTRYEGAVQFAGEIVAQGSALVGSGKIRGEGCVNPGNGRFCGAPAPAVIDFRFDPRQQVSDIRGELRVTTPAGVEIWPVVLDQWRIHYLVPSKQRGLEGSWTELVAEFVGDGSSVVTVDAQGRLFFQSPAAGCTGNGTLAPYLDGNFNVFDFALSVGNCTGSYSYLNGEYAGLATTTPTDWWGYDSAIRAWMSKTGVAQPSAAVTMFAPFIY